MVTQSGMGNTRKDLDDEVRELAENGADDRDICEFLDIDPDRLQEEFARILVRKRASRRIELRKKQTHVALNGNASMLIFLGKNELGQTPKSGTDDEPHWPEPQLDPKVG